MAIVASPEFLQTQSYAAQRLRYQQEDFTPNGEGVMGQADFRVSQRGAGANMSVDIAAGAAIVRGDSIARQGLYHVVNDATINAAVSANASGNPRIDIVTVQCSDSTDSGSGTDVSTINVIAGTPTGGATLDNRSGAAAIPNNQLHLADVLVANGAVSILDASIRSRRPFGKLVVPPLVGFADVDQVPMLPVYQPQTDLGNGFLAANVDLRQAAALHWLPKRIVNATRIRWEYVQGGTATTGNYIFAIYDASGRQVAATASTAFAGAANARNARSEPLLATTTFEAGMYYVLFGQDNGAAGSVFLNAIDLGFGQAPVPNVLLGSIAAGVTLPATNTILGLGDLNTGVAANFGYIPHCSLSVG